MYWMALVVVNTLTILLIGYAWKSVFWKDASIGWRKAGGRLCEPQQFYCGEVLNGQRWGRVYSTFQFGNLSFCMRLKKNPCFRGNASITMWVYTRNRRNAKKSCSFYVGPLVGSVSQLSTHTSNGECTDSETDDRVGLLFRVTQLSNLENVD